MSKILNLQKRKSQDPAEIAVEHPNLDDTWRTHLLYLLDYHPTWVLNLYQNDPNELKRVLLSVVQRAQLMKDILSQKGKLAREQIEEHVCQSIVYPIEHQPPPPNQLSESQRLSVLDWSDNLKIKDSLSL